MSDEKQGRLETNLRVAVGVADQLADNGEDEDLDKVKSLSVRLVEVVDEEQFEDYLPKHVITAFCLATSVLVDSYKTLFAERDKQ